jgi:putative transposon-encoded protein
LVNFTDYQNRFEKSIAIFNKPKRRRNVPNEKNLNPKDDKEPTVDAPNDIDALSNKVKFEIYGEEMIEKRVKSSGNSGRVYLPPNWVGHKVKIIRI